MSSSDIGYHTDRVIALSSGQGNVIQGCRAIDEHVTWILPMARSSSRFSAGPGGCICGGVESKQLTKVFYVHKL